MLCERCGDTIEKDDEREYSGRLLCEDCYMDALSPARACDPWAVHAAKSFQQASGEDIQINPVQEKIMKILEETGGIEPANLVERLQIKPTDLERELASLRHMEKIGGKLQNGKKIIVPWRHDS